MIQEKIKVLVVDDSAFMRKVISDMLKDQDSLSVIGIARNGQEAVEKVKLLKPDIVTLDVEMPIMNGLEALKVIMSEAPLPVVMLSSLTSDGADATIMALEAGAVDFIQKPSSVFSINIDAVKKELIEKIQVASSVKLKQKKQTVIDTSAFVETAKNEAKVKNEVKVKNENKVKNEAKAKNETKAKNNPIRVMKGSSNIPLVAIGTSTGGPRALQSVIPLIPAGVEASFLIVQHMPAGFTKSLANRLNSLSEIHVKEAENGEIILPSTAYIAPGGYHLGIREGHNQDLYIELSQSPPVSGHRPSVDAMFESLTVIRNRPIIGVIMTGMGADGSKGLKSLKDTRNAFVIAQNEETCVVYGMPKNAVRLGVVDEVIPLENIHKSILNRLEVL